LPTQLVDVQSDRIRFSTSVDIHDEMERERKSLSIDKYRSGDDIIVHIVNVQRCRDERKRIIDEESSAKTVSNQKQRSTRHRVDISTMSINIFVAF
jgi:hypothetical protein